MAKRIRTAAIRWLPKPMLWAPVTPPLTSANDCRCYSRYHRRLCCCSPIWTFFLLWIWCIFSCCLIYRNRKWKTTGIMENGGTRRIQWSKSSAWLRGICYVTNVWGLTFTWICSINIVLGWDNYILFHIFVLETYFYLIKFVYLFFIWIN